MQFSAIAQDHIQAPRNAGAVSGATHIGVGGTPGEGPYVRLSLIVCGERVERSGFECNGCPSSIAISSLATQVLTGRTVGQALSITPEDLLTILGGLPEGKEYYAQLAVEAIQDALGHELTKNSGRKDA